MSECRTVNNDAAVWPMVLVLEGVEVTRAMVPIKEVWIYPDHDFVEGVCTRCGEKEAERLRKALERIAHGRYPRYREIAREALGEDSRAPPT